MSSRLAACAVAACLLVSSFFVSPAAADSGDRIRITPLPRGTTPRKRTPPVAPPPPEAPPGSYVPPGRQTPPDRYAPPGHHVGPRRQSPPQHPTPDQQKARARAFGHLVRAAVGLTIMAFGFFRSRNRDHH